jgi:hypothetical protein
MVAESIITTPQTATDTVRTDRTIGLPEIRTVIATTSSSITATASTIIVVIAWRTLEDPKRTSIGRRWTKRTKEAEVAKRERLYENSRIEFVITAIFT